MDYNQLLHDFLDGSLEQQNEQQLFIALASNDELRRELKQMVAIKTAVKSDFSAFQPSKESENKIFSSLGFTLNQSSSIPIPQKRILTWNKLSGYLSVGFLAALTTAILMMIIPRDDKNPNLQSIATKVDTIYIEKKYISDIPQFTQNTIKDLFKTTNNSVDVNQHNVDNIEKEEYNESIHKNIEPVLKNIPISHIFTLNSDNSLIRNELIKPELMKNDQTLGFTIQINGHTNWYNTKTIIHPEKYQNFNNLSIGLLYNLSNEVVLGLTYRRDNYLQNFRITENNKTYEITQQPNFNNILLTFQYQPDIIILEHFKPISELNVGFNEVGYVGALMLGTEIFPYSFSTFVIGFEFSNLAFKEQKNWYLSNKYGFIYGIKLKL